MAVRIGDLLLQEGIITGAQLEEALKYQVIFGGKLGTNLIEMGLVEEADVARVLSKKLGVPTVTADELMQVPAPVLQTVPRDLIETYRVVPVRLEGRRLTLAMADPANLKAIDEIAFRTGLVLRPVVVAEVRLVLALEQHFQIERDRRYIHAAKQVSGKRREAREPEPAAVPAAPRPAAAELVIDLEELVEVKPPAAAAPEPVEEIEEIADAETVSDNLAEACDRDDILDTLAAYLAHEFAGSAVILVRGGMALGWKATSEHHPVPHFSQVEIPLDETSVLKTVAESRAFFLGPVPRAPFNSMLLQELGGRVPKTVLLVPLLMMGRVVGILYVDDPKVDLGEQLFELQKLTAKAAMAFEILVLKNKILSM